jgi:hypothetical protein
VECPHQAGQKAILTLAGNLKAIQDSIGRDLKMISPQACGAGDAVVHWEATVHLLCSPLMLLNCSVIALQSAKGISLP